MLQYENTKKYKHTNRLINLWNREFANIAPVSRQFYKTHVLDDVNFNKEASFVAIYDNEPVGFIIMKTWRTDSGLDNEENTAHISLIFVKKEMRNMGIGSDLLQLSLNEIKKYPKITKIEVGNEVNKLMSGVLNDLPGSLIFFVNKGFIQREGVVDMIKVVKKDTLTTYDHGGLDVRIATDEDKDAILKFCVENKWQRSAYLLNEYFNNGGTGRRIVLAYKEENLIGLARIYEENKSPIRVNIFLKDNHVGGIAFLGIGEAYTNLNYDLVLNNACISYLIRRGCKKILVPSTKKVQYYKKLGFSAFKYYLRFDLTL